MILIYDSTTRQWKEIADIPKYYVNGQFRIMAGKVYHNGSWKRAWISSKISVNIPTLSGTYTYAKNTAQTVTISSYDTTLISQSGTQTATNAGTYEVIFSLKNPREYCWSDGSSADKRVSWTINKRSITVPSVSGTYTYTSGTPQYVSFNNEDSNYMTKSGTTYATNAGTYHVYFSLSDTNNTQWVGGSTSRQDISWVINKRYLTIPTFSGSPTYTGNTIYLSTYLSNYNTTYESLTGTVSSTNAGSFTASATLKDTTNTAWVGGSTTAQSISWSIGKKKLSVPYQSSVPTYSGSTIYLSSYLYNYDSSLETLSGTTSSTNAGTFSASVSLSNTTNYCWTDESTSSKSISWTINKMKLTIPTVKSTVPTYTGSSINLTDYLNNYNSTYENLTGTYYSTNAGTFTAYAGLKNTTNTSWSDGTTANKTLTWTINRKSLTIPTRNTSYSYTYTGSSQTVALNNYDSNTMSVTGNTQTNAGSYTAVVSLKNTTNYMWVGGSTSSQSISWSIAKKKTWVKITTDKTIKAGETTTVSYTTNGGFQARSASHTLKNKAQNWDLGTIRTYDSYIQIVTNGSVGTSGKKAYIWYYGVLDTTNYEIDDSLYDKSTEGSTDFYEASSDSYQYIHYNETSTGSHYYAISWSAQLTLEGYA